MKKFLVGVIVLILMSFTLISCSEPTKEDEFDRLQVKLDKVKSYKCTMKIKIQGNRSPKSYIAEYIYQKPNKYFIKYLKPKESKGFTTIFNGKQLQIFHPNIKQSLIINELDKKPVGNLILGDFLEIIKKCDPFNITSQTINENEFFVISVNLSENDNYRTSQKLLINKKSYEPYKLITYDKDGKEAIEIFFVNFKYNEKFDNNIFNVQL